VLEQRFSAIKFSGKCNVTRAIFIGNFHKKWWKLQIILRGRLAIFSLPWCTLWDRGIFVTTSLAQSLLAASSCLHGLFYR
jgi:hypothetical protein